MFSRFIRAAIFVTLTSCIAGCHALSGVVERPQSGRPRADEKIVQPTSNNGAIMIGGARNLPAGADQAHAIVGEAEQLRMQTNDRDQERKARAKSESAGQAAGDPFLTILVLGLIIIVIEGAQK